MNEVQVKEINEAIIAGKELINEIEIIENKLAQAKTWGFIDLFSDGGLITSIFKHSKLNDAQNEMDKLKYCLNKFNDELDDIKVDNNISQIAMSNGIQLADWLLDGLFLDAYTLQKIYKSSNELKDLKSKVISILNNLETFKNY